MPPTSDALSRAIADHKAGRTEDAKRGYRLALEGAPDNADAMFNLGVLLASEGRFGEAEDMYLRVSKIAPGDAAVMSNLGNLMQLQGRSGEAEDYYRRAIDLDPELAEAQVNLANLYFSRGEGDAAVETFRRSLDIKPTMVQARASLGIALAALGRGDEAERELEIALALDPDCADALGGMGARRFAEKDYAAAERFYRRALEIDPNAARSHYNLATVLEKRGEHAPARAALRRALELDPDYLEARRNLAALMIADEDFAAAETELDACRRLAPDDAETEFHYGSLYLARSDNEEAVAHLQRAVALNPGLAEAYNNLGNGLFNLKRYDEAVVALRRALELSPNSAHAHNNLGNALSSLGDAEGAIEEYKRAVEADPGLDVALTNLGNALRAGDRLDEALQWFDKALETNPDLYAAYNGIGLTLQSYNRQEEAIEAFKKAIAIKPHYSQALNNIAISYQDIGRPGEAIKAYEEVLQHHPELTEVYFNLGTLLQLLNRYDESVTVFKKALLIKPDYTVVYPYLAHALMQQCSWTNLEAIIENVLNDARNAAERGTGISVSAFGLQSLPASMELRLEAAKQISKRSAGKVRDIKAAMPKLEYARPADNRIRVGFVSPDFRFHSVSVAFKSVLSARDRNRFAYYGYAINTYGVDAMTQFFMTEFDKYVNITDTAYRETAEKIHGDGVNILVDLAGHTRGNRPEIFALEPAPIQAHWLGFSSTIGADYIQYLITDKVQLPPEDQKYCTEKLVYLPETFMATSRPEVLDITVPRHQEGLPKDAFVFANFNSHYKFYPTMFDIWMRLLRKVPNSVLWLLAGTATSQKNLILEAEKRGIDPERVVFARTIAHHYHLARLKNADLCIDNLLHGGGVTTTDALWVGVPVLTLWGDSPPARNGATLVKAIGAPELTTYTLAEYEKRAYELANDPDQLRSIREKLLRNRDTYPLFDVQRLTRHLERGFELMWENYAAGNPPRNIEVPALPFDPDEKIEGL